jgi:radical SAM protein with 4Fe4S-binding SPASM domain
VIWPRSLVWEVTPRCPLRCGHCYCTWTAAGADLPAELDTAGLTRVLEALAPARRHLRSLTFSGGEPLLRQDLPELARRAGRVLPGAQLTVATSGWLLDDGRARELAQAGIPVVQLTLLAARPGMHDRLTGAAGSFDRTLAAIPAARRAGLRVAVFFVAMRENIEELPGVARLAVALGADTVVLNRFQPGGRGLDAWQERTPTHEQLERALHHRQQLQEQTGLQLGTPIPPCEGGPAMACPVGTRQAYPAVGPDGTLRPCNHSPRVAGSLLERPLVELLRNAAMRPCTPGELPEECSGCHHSGTCRGGCLAARRQTGKGIYHGVGA